MSMVAGTAKIISEAFNVGFSRSIPGWRTEVAAPAGMSTEGGKQALLPITLVNDAGQRVAIGHADALNRRVTLKSHHAISRGYAMRYNRGFEVSPEQHGAMLDSLSSFFTAMQYDMVIDERSSYPELPRQRDDSSWGPWIMLLVAVVISACLVAYGLTR